jgi:hypothetical protein
VNLLAIAFFKMHFGAQQMMRARNLKKIKTIRIHFPNLACIGVGNQVLGQPR